MSFNHPHWFMHYVPVGSVFTACGRRRIEVSYATNGTADVTCRWCLQSDEYLAYSMEKTLSPAVLPLNTTMLDQVARDVFKKDYIK